MDGGEQVPVARVAVSEFGLMQLDRAARCAGEAFASEDAAGRMDDVQVRGNGLWYWSAVAIAALAGFAFLV